jgi:Protein of unknown function (DUF3987)/Bifunctional DNA primase/polymerase, N-terminal
VTTSTRNGSLTPREAAEQYLRDGLAPIPMPERSKDPGYSDWQRLRVTAETFDKFFPQDHRFNIGILNGLPSGNHVDVDLDCSQAIVVASKLLPPTGWIFGRASARQSHWIYVTTSPLMSAQVSFKDIDDQTMLCELRGTGGLTVFPPSQHRETGEPITWDAHTTPAEIALDDLKQAVCEVASAALLARHWPMKGSRDEAAMALTGALIRAEWGPDKVSRFVEAVTLAAGDDEVRMRAGKAERTQERLSEGGNVTGWPRLAKIVGDGVVNRVRLWLGIRSQVSTVKPIRPLPDYRGFPLDALPGPARDYCREVAAATGTDPAFSALPCLAAIAGVIGNSRRMMVKYAWYEPAIVWAVPIADSGAVKTPPAELAIKPVHEIDIKLQEEFQTKDAKYRDELAEWEKAKKADRGEKPVAPKPGQVIAGIVTVEAMIELLADNPHGLLVYQDELDGWLNSFGMYHKSGKASCEVPHWLSFHGGRPVRVNRKTGDRKFLYAARTALSVTGTIQPGTLKRSLTPEFFSCGLAARMLFAMPPRRKKVWSEKDLSAKTAASYQAMIEGLYKLDFMDDNDRPSPVLLQFTDDARNNFIRFFGEWADKQFEAEGELSAAFSKLEGYAIRFSLIHHCAQQVADGCVDPLDCSPVTADDLDAGITLARWFADECERVYQMVAETSDDEHSRRLVEYIRGRGGHITAKELQQSNGKKYPSSQIAEEQLEALVKANAGLWQPRNATERGGRPTRDFVLYDDTDDTDETQDDDSEQPEDHPTKPQKEAHSNRRNPSETQGKPVSSDSSVSSDRVENNTESDLSVSSGFVGQNGASEGVS